MHIFIKVGGRLRGERLSYLSMYLFYIIFLSFSQKFSRSLRSLDCVNLHFILYLNNASMQCALPTPFIFFLFLVLLSLSASFQNSLKTRTKLPKISYKISKKLFAGVGWRKRGGGGRGLAWHWGEERHGCWGDRRPWKPVDSVRSFTG